MAVILVPNTVQLKAYGTVGGNPWVCLIHFNVQPTTPPMTATMLNAMCTAFYTDAVGRWSTDWPASVTLTGVTALDLSSNTPAVGASTGPPVTGSGTGLQDAAACTMFNFHTGSRYRGGHGRMYWPGGVTSYQQDSLTWQTTHVGTWQTAMQLAISDTIGAAVAHGGTNIFHCIPRYSYDVTNDPIHKKYIRTRVAWLYNDQVYSVTCNPRIKTQRRRLGS